MEFRQLKYFVTIVDSGSMMKASERLHVAQPALSVQLANLEIELGTKLVTRSNRGVHLTDDGAELYERAVTMLRYHQEALNELKVRKHKAKGRVSIGLPSTISSMATAEIYRTVRDNIPGVKLYIVDASTSIIYELLQEGKIDLAVLFSLPENSGVEVFQLYMEEFSLVGPPSDNLHNEEIEFEKIFSIPIAIPSKSTVWRKILDDAAEKQGKTLRPPIETESFSALRALALAGDCYALLPHSSVQDEVKAGILRARKIINPELRGMISLANLNSREMSKAARDVRNILIKIFHELAERRGLDLQFPSNTQILRATPSQPFPIEPKGRNRSA